MKNLLNKQRPVRQFQESLMVFILMGGFLLGALTSSGRFSFFLSPWFTPFFGLMYLNRSFLPLKVGLRNLFFGLWIGLGISWYGATPIWGFAHVIFMGVNAFFGVLPYVMYGLLKNHGWLSHKPLLQSLIFPAGVVVFEWLGIHGSPFGSFGSEAYSQFGFLPFLQVLSVSGMLGVGFIVAWFGSCLFYCVDYGCRVNDNSPSRGQKQAFKLGSTFALVFGVILLWGTVRIVAIPEAQQTIQITGITLEPVSMHEFAPMLSGDLQQFRDRTGELHQRYLVASAQAADSGSRVVVWPELAGIGTFDDVLALYTRASHLAESKGIFLVIPTMSLDPLGEKQALNQVRIFDPTGSAILTHVKFGGNFIEGTVGGEQKVQVVDTEIGRIAAVICWDTDFPGVIAQAGRQGADILFSPAVDWEGINPLHGQMAVFRGIENGMSVVRQADSGWSVISDSYGRILSSASGPEQHHTAEVPVPGVGTLYPLWGNWVGWSSFLYLVVLFLPVGRDFWKKFAASFIARRVSGKKDNN